MLERIIKVIEFSLAENPLWKIFKDPEISIVLYFLYLTLEQNVKEQKTE